jgi:AraC-like DNA-binding protein
MHQPLAWHGSYMPWIASAVWPLRGAPWEYPQRRLYDYLLVCSFDGEEWIRAENHRSEIRVPRGAAYLLPPGVLVDKGSRTGNRPAMCHFDVRYHEQREERPRQGPYDHDLAGRDAWLQPTPRETWGIDLPILLPQELWPACRKALPAIVEAWIDGDPMTTLRAQHRLHDILLSFVEWAAAQQGSKVEANEARIARAERVALQSLGRDFGIEQFAAAAGLRRSHFHARYRELRHESPAVFLRREKLHQAERLLRREELSIADIGRMVGYDDPAIFTRAFRRQYGMPPQQWRRNH